LPLDGCRRDFTREDATPEIGGLNEAIWKSIKGHTYKMPAPLHKKIIGSEPGGMGGE
jgi:hypothetical protein